jgi:2,5-diketo-D-gluconate reductase A
VLRWHIQLGNVVIPKSVTPTRIEENFKLFDFELSDDDMHALFELDREERTGPDPETFGQWVPSATAPIPAPMCSSTCRPA